MRVFLLPSTFTCSNMGDVAMLQCAVQRFSRSWPDAVVSVPTREPESLATHCPEATPVPYRDWYADRYLLGGLHRVLPGPLRMAIHLKKAARDRIPELEIAGIRLKHVLFRGEKAGFNQYRAALRSADLIAMAGAGGIGDVFPLWSSWALETMREGLRRRKPVVLLGQGFGELTGTELRRNARSVLPRANLIALRERHNGPQLLRGLGIDESRVLVTGDDAIEASYDIRAAALGPSLGVSLRLGTLTGLSRDAIGWLGPSLKAFASKRNAALRSLPISRDQLADSQALRSMFDYESIEDAGESLDTPLKVMRETSRCRVVVTTTYHAGVFALSQGIPALCLAKSAYFANKFRGLETQFGAGCRVIEMNGTGAAPQFNASLHQLWDRAEYLIPDLLAAARDQITLSRAAYRRAADLVSARIAAHP